MAKPSVSLYLLYRSPIHRALHSYWDFYGFEYIYNEISSVHLKQGYNLACGIINKFQWATKFSWALGQWLTMPIGKFNPAY